MAIILTFGFSEAPGAVGEKLGHIGEGRTLGYSAHGAAGMLTLFMRAVMCNWMVSTGVVAAMMSTTVSGKAIGMWMPVMVFFYMGFEHSIVNMFLFPTGLMLGGNFTLMDYLIWNEIPVVLGNLVGGLAFTGPLYSFVSSQISGLATWYHKEVGSTILLVLVGLHLAAIVFYRAVKQQRLVRAMLSGDQAVNDQELSPSQDSTADRLLALAVFAGCAAGMAYIASLGG
jgi:hypothetical protein